MKNQLHESFLTKRLGSAVLQQHQYYMREALLEAKKALSKGEVPVGAVVVHGDHIVARAHNTRETEHDPTAHAEITALRLAGQRIGSWRLTDAVIYVTLEPCPMCSGAMLQSRVGHLVFGAFDEKAGAVGSVIDLIRSEIFANSIQVTGGVLATACSDILQQFFLKKRCDIERRCSVEQVEI